MTRFKIIQSDPAEHKEQILEFWKEYLPGTPPGRFEWMHKNPAGPPIWFLAFDEENHQLAGTISIMPRKMTLNGKSIKAGIVGDFMVSSQYRVFGPALHLQKMVIESMSTYGFNFVYTIPNQASIKMNQRAGYINAITLVRFVKPVCSAPYIRKYFNDKLSNLIGSILDFVLKLVSKETYYFSRGLFDEDAIIDESFNALWDEIKKVEANLIGDHSAEYIYWRYFQNPISNFRLITLRNKSDGILLGYIVFSIFNGKINIYDLISLKQNDKNGLLKKLIHVARSEKCQSIYIRLSESNLYIKDIRKFMFYNARNDIDLLSFGEGVSIFEQWAFSEGDRNS